MMLADIEGIDAEAIGQHRLVDHVAEHRSLGPRPPVGVERHVPERVQAQLDAVRRSCHSPMIARCDDAAGSG